jgi:hypothetical protein
MRSPTVALLCGLTVSACASNRFPGPPMPIGMAPVSEAQVGEWIDATRPDTGQLVRFRARVLREGTSGWVRGVAWIAPPDSLRFDFRGPLGSGNGAAAVVGDSALWAEPEEEVQKLVPSYPLLWAMLGQVRHPPAGATLRGFEDDRVRAWQSVLGIDTVDYLFVSGERREMVADVRQGATRIGRVHTTFDPEGRLLKSRLDIPSGPARITLDFSGHRTIAGIPDSLWQRPVDAP